MDNQKTVKSLTSQLYNRKPFSFLAESFCDAWFNESKLVKILPGQTIISPRQLQDRIYLVVQGTVRLLHDSEGDINTIGKRNAGQLLGWASLLRASSCEWISASETTVVLALPSKYFLQAFHENSKFFEWFARLGNIHESYAVATAAINLMPKRYEGWSDQFEFLLENVVVSTVNPGQPFVPSLDSKQVFWHLSTYGVPNHDVGQMIVPGQILPMQEGFNLPYRVIGLSSWEGIGLPPDIESQIESLATPLSALPAISLQQLGIVEKDTQTDDDIYPIIRGKGMLEEAMAVCEMLALSQSIPFRKDMIKKILENQFRRDKSLTLELIAGLSEVMGFSSQLGVVDNAYLGSIESPALLMLEGCPVIVFEMFADRAILGDPRKGLRRVPLTELQEQLSESVRFALPRKIASTPSSRFGWSWFTPLLIKYRRALVLVFISSLLAQLFGLAIPLLIQQIIDKVLTQGNMSSLNVIGAVMIVLAVFQGLLIALRQYIFVDTTDRMDLTLGSAVIDRMLSLPLTFFEKRPVGELSQRLGELNTIRGFLTGTALSSVLNLIFASLYLVVMIVYSPLLTAVALSTFPFYALLVFGIAPLYRYLIRQRAVAQAKTQSHLIEILSGIQTVKAQHFELTARWKWQDRYRHFVSEGFKGVILGTASATVGSILNQISSLLVLWVGMYLVLQGDLTLGMLIAFRIIAGNVTGPLMQLSGLYQGFQKVQVSMERLSDILDQNPELSRSDDIDQIAMPSIQGAVRFEDVRFRFTNKGPYQVNRVSLSIDPGSFVGIVGQSGSGKSTLMKLLPRLYEPDMGRIFVDDYDINKVELSSLRRQIGIIPQDSLLFEGTISENIALNDPQASNEAIIQAAKLACAHDFIMSLGQGYATPIAERGGNLSGGQRQRIAIARTILSDPQLLVMDEATSALDYTTERQLCLNLQDWAKGRTVFFITHRLSSIKNSDVILVMHEGDLVEQGTHSSLIEKGERYAALYRQQNE
ncbi:peptidase domain-containing ABC transporter [Synechococcus sp. AH-601-P18]|nr:peptidase domain-containing ABC transporter [Synechococcus sp. AH-601-P18]